MKKARISRKELFFQVVLHILVLLFYSFDKNNPGITFAQLVFFLAYTIFAAFITYFLMPRFLYRKKYWQFLGLVVLVLFGLIWAEELLELVFYPGTKKAIIVPGIYYAIFDVLPVIAILSGFKFAWDAISSQSEVEKLKMSAQENELQFLKSQINPHFLFNNLNNLYSYAIDNSPKTPTIILELSSVLRYMLYDCKERYVLLSKEIEHLRNYTQLSELQIENRGVVDFNTDITGSGYHIAPLILTVFVENAFKHSTASQSEDIFISVDIKVSENGLLHFECTNSFRRETNTDDLSHGIGLQNVKKRLRLIYPAAHSLSIDETDTTYSVKLGIDLKKDNT
ncbi:histidine kinase [Arenibacter sp. M-2]|uniref:sensor histidine kinase n=1 Tax=unclassified Arenibacter TaxID=2615047 RepID=UPI000D771F3F|nr:MULTISPECIES: histidine kinase [unclassified Arenibacter]MDL5514832.1 histidine kinase [Arenibacter sp. M-2]PXX30427.1 GHKL domain-containing protein [Arenibacter sp. ARW7G5Y1]|tara:strand:- start:62401 stop:63417 length:1017 start_codon:yes stop_codon:yes gene_type:complete